MSEVATTNEEQSPEKKRALLARHGVRLLEWRFDVRITRAELIAQMAAMEIQIPD